MLNWPLWSDGVFGEAHLQWRLGASEGNDLLSPELAAWRANACEGGRVLGVKVHGPPARSDRTSWALVVPVEILGVEKGTIAIAATDGPVSVHLDGNARTVADEDIVTANTGDSLNLQPIDGTKHAFELCVAVV